MLRLEDCGALDVGCQVASGINEQIAEFGTTMAAWLGGIIKGSLNVDSQVSLFTATMRGDFANQGFVNQFNFWLILMASVVITVAMVQWAIAAILGNGRRIVVVFVSVLLAVPTTYVGLLLFDGLNTVMNQATDALMGLTIGAEEGGLAKALLAMTGLQNFYVDDATSTNPWAVFSDLKGKTMGGVFGGGMSPLAAIVVIGLLLIAAAFLAIAMLVRTFGLVVLAVVAPIALMWVGQPKFKVWAIRWTEAVLGLLLAKPLAAAIIGVAVAIAAGDPADAPAAAGQVGNATVELAAAAAADSAPVTDFWGVIAAFVGLLMAAASPAVTLGLVRFASDGIAQAVGSRPSMSSAVHKTQLVIGAAKGGARLFGGGGRGPRGASRGSSGHGGGTGSAGGRGAGGAPGSGRKGGNGKAGSAGAAGSSGSSGGAGNSGAPGSSGSAGSGGRAGGRGRSGSNGGGGGSSSPSGRGSFYRRSGGYGRR